MIGKLTGLVALKESSFLILDVSGVGYKVFSTEAVILSTKIGKNLSLWTHLVVRENALDLYGFENEEVLSIFNLLITVSGIGPKSALGILNLASADTLKEAVANEDTEYLTKVSGIGKKNAEKIVLELRGKLFVDKDSKSNYYKDEGDAILALVSIGYSDKEAREVLKKVPKEITNTSERVKKALQFLSTKN